MTMQTKQTKQTKQSNPKQKQSDFAGRRVRGYRRPMDNYYLLHPALREGQFSLYDVPAMMMDDTVQIGLCAIYGAISGATFEFHANSREIKDFVERTFRRFWQHDLSKVLHHYVPWGTVAGEAMFEQDADTGLWGYCGFDDFDIRDVQPWKRGRHLSKFRVAPGGMGVVDPDGYKRTEEDPIEWNVVRPPKALWVAHRPLCGSLRGHSTMEAAWGPWMEKCGTHGAISIRRLWAFANAFRGVIVKYPDGFTEREDGAEIANSQIAKEIAEAWTTGGASVCPSATDENGKPLWEIVDAKMNGEVASLLEYPNDLNRAILRGMGVLDEVISAPDTGGSWSGRSGPLLIFLNSCDFRVKEIATGFDVGPSGYTGRNEQTGGVLRSLVLENFGPKARYAVRPISLVPKPAEPGAGGTGAGGMPGQPPPGPGGSPMGPPPGQMDVPTQPAGGNPIKLSAGDDGSVELPDAEVEAILNGVQLSATETPPVENPKRAKPQSDDNSTLDLANLYAHMWHGLTPEEVGEKELGTVHDELADGEHHLHWNSKDGWHVKHTSEGEGVQLSTKHAPKGGIVIAGKVFKGGMFIPNEDYQKATPEEKAAIDNPKEARADVRRARGSINHDTLQEKLAAHAHHELTKQELTSAKRSFNALHRHHGDLVLHRLEEIADMLQAAHDREGNTEGQTEQYSRRLKAVQHQIEMAKGKGVHGEVAAKVKAVSPLDELLGQAEKYRNYGPDYDRNIASSARRVEEMKNAGRDKEAEHWAKELKARLDAKAGAPATGMPEPIPPSGEKPGRYRKADVKTLARYPEGWFALDANGMPIKFVAEYDTLANDLAKKFPGASTKLNDSAKVSPAELSKLKDAGKKQKRGTFALRSIVKDMGGISYKSLEALGFSVKDLREMGVGSLFSEKGRSLEEIASTLHNEGHIIIPGVQYDDRDFTAGGKSFPLESAQYVLDLLEQKAKSLHADHSKAYEKSHKQYLKDQVDAAKEFTPAEISEAESIEDSDVESEETHGDSWEGPEGVAASEGEVDPWDMPTTSEPQAEQATSTTEEAPHRNDEHGLPMHLDDAIRMEEELVQGQAQQMAEAVNAHVPHSKEKRQEFREASAKFKARAEQVRQRIDDIRSGKYTPPKSKADETPRFKAGEPIHFNGDLQGIVSKVDKSGDVYGKWHDDKDDDEYFLGHQSTAIESSEAVAPSHISDAELFKRSGEGFENLQKALGVKQIEMGPSGAEKVRKALAEHPGGGVIAALLSVDGSQTNYSRNGFAERGSDAFRSAIDGKFTKLELQHAAKWLEDEYNLAKENGSLKESRFIRDAVLTAKPSDGSETIQHSREWNPPERKPKTRIMGEDMAHAESQEIDGVLFDRFETENGGAVRLIDADSGNVLPQGLTKYPSVKAAQDAYAEHVAKARKMAGKGDQSARKPIESADISHAKRKLAGGNLSIKGNATSEPITSDLSGEQIRRYVELPNGARIHPDELQRVKFDGKEAILDPRENITVKDPLNKGDASARDFATALRDATAYNGHDDDRVTLQTPRGYSVTKTRGEWRDVAKSHEGGSMSAWYDRENPQAVSDAAAKSEKPAATMGGEDESADFFKAPADQQGLYSWDTPDVNAETAEDKAVKAKYADKPKIELLRAPAGGKTSDVDGVFYKGGRLMPVHGLSPKTDKSKSDGTGAGVTAKADEDKAKGSTRQPRNTEMSPEDIEAEKQKRERQSKWDEVRSGPIGQFLSMGDNAHYIKRAQPGLTGWQKWADTIPDEKLAEIRDAARDMATKAMAAKNGDDDAKEYRDYQDEWFANKTNDYMKKGHAKEKPTSQAALHWVGEAIQNGGVDAMHQLHQVMTSAPPSPKEPEVSGEGKATPARGLKDVLRDTQTAERQLGKLMLKGVDQDDPKRKELEDKISSLNSERASLRSKRQSTAAASTASKPTGFDPSQSYAVDGKEPWEMTGKEWQAARDKMRPDDSGNGQMSPSSHAAHIGRVEKLTLGGKIGTDNGDGGKFPVTHADVIETALAAGKPVPPSVLADYPDLQAKYGKTTTSEPPAPAPLPEAAKGDGGKAAGGKPAEADDYNYANAIKISADSIAKLRKVDVYRVMDSMRSDQRLKGMAAYIISNRPDLKKEVDEQMEDIAKERGYGQ